jgi:hypothetical protein
MAGNEVASRSHYSFMLAAGFPGDSTPANKMAALGARVVREPLAGVQGGGRTVLQATTGIMTSLSGRTRSRFSLVDLMLDNP